ncbi:helix-turn-helix domain-containing protein [Streptomyces omiyaensis]|uniref:helix-turn-helix domain-containing protein n=1 Tax=Streptomyces omiyaensis TaxID=68247 RepID=UPI0036FAB799
MRGPFEAIGNVPTTSAARHFLKLRATRPTELTSRAQGLARQRTTGQGRETSGRLHGWVCCSAASNAGASGARAGDPGRRHRDRPRRSTSIAALSRLVRREPGGRAKRGADAARLRETALVRLEQGSMAKAAESLSLHTSTVLPRMRQVEGVLPQPLDERRMACEVALRAVATLGERALPE